MRAINAKEMRSLAEQNFDTDLNNEITSISNLIYKTSITTATLTYLNTSVKLNTLSESAKRHFEANGYAIKRNDEIGYIINW